MTNVCGVGASKLIQETMRVTLIEAGDLSKTKAWQLPPDAYSNRVSSITNASQEFLRSALYHNVQFSEYY